MENTCVADGKNMDEDVPHMPYRLVVFSLVIMLQAVPL